MFNIGPQELLLILIVALLVVGPKRLPELGRTIGRGLSELRKAQDEVQRTIRGALDEPTPSSRPSPTPATPESAEPAHTAGAEATATPDAAPAAGADPASEAARSLGQGLAELRRAREEIQRTFRLDLDDHRPGE